jgi:hypothetical protein
MHPLDYENAGRSRLARGETFFWPTFAVASLLGCLTAIFLDTRLHLFDLHGTARINADNVAIHIACIGLAAGLAVATRAIRGPRQSNPIFAAIFGLCTAPILFCITALIASL